MSERQVTAKKMNGHRWIGTIEEIADHAEARYDDFRDASPMADWEDLVVDAAQEAMEADIGLSSLDHPDIYDQVKDELRDRLKNRD